MTRAVPEQITNSSVYPYANEVIVELTGIDADGDLVVVSYQFEYQNDGESVTPKQSVDPEYRTHVAEGLAESKYEWPGGPDV